MSIKSLLVTLGILGSSSLALADHDFRYDRRSRIELRDRDGARFEYDRYRDRDAYRDVRDRDVYRPRSTWTPLTSRQRLDRGGDTFHIHSREPFAQLRLQNQTGRTFVRHIEITFESGERQVVHVHRMLDGNYAMVNIDLDGRARRIAHVHVDGRSGRGASYQLYAM